MAPCTLHTATDPGSTEQVGHTLEKKWLDSHNKAQLLGKACSTGHSLIVVPGVISCLLDVRAPSAAPGPPPVSEGPPSRVVAGLAVLRAAGAGHRLPASQHCKRSRRVASSTAMTAPEPVPATAEVSVLSVAGAISVT